MLEYVGIDDWGRPVFVDKATGRYYGSVDRIFNDGTDADDVVPFLTEKDLCYFGRYFGCEPMGDPMPDGLKIKRERLD